MESAINTLEAQIISELEDALKYIDGISPKINNLDYLTITTLLSDVRDTLNFYFTLKDTTRNCLL